MSDDYQVPTSVPATNPTQAPNPYGASGVLGDGPAIKYLCGDCNASVMLKRGDPIRCKECGHRVLYKERTSRYVDSFREERGVKFCGRETYFGDRMVQFEAR